MGGESDSSESAASISAGTDIDNYRIVRLLGRGGMGEVYLARDCTLGRKAALKFIRPRALGAPSAVERFLFEARSTARFSHPHIVTVYGVGEHEGRPYVALEYLEGQSLAERIAVERLGLRAALRIIRAIADALAEAHRAGILHRDLKPENVFLPKDGRPRVLDFGLARAFDVAEPTSPDASTAPPPSTPIAPLASTGKGFRGTPAYMAPEQWRREEAGTAADIWAIGLIMHELLLGRRPYDDQDLLALAVKVVDAAPVPSVAGADGVPAPIAELVDGCLHKTPAARPSIDQVLQVLDSVLRGQQATGADDVAPFRGLLQFSERHADWFFGREREVASLAERLREQATLVVVGPSGAGKSSFVHAGLVPRLREEGRTIVLGMRPGHEPFSVLAARILAGERSAASPFASPAADGARGTTAPALRASPTAPGSSAAGGAEHELAAALRAEPRSIGLRLQALAVREQARVLLVVDQLEELCTLELDDHAREAFLLALVTAADDPAAPVRVVATLRDDFLGRLSSQPEVREALGRVGVLGKPDADALRAIVTRPVELAGYRYEDGRLPTEMIAEVANEVACLPLLQFACSALWDKRDSRRRVLTRADYVELGGVAGALAKHADGLLDGLSAAEERLVRQIALRLVTTQGTRRVVERSELLDGLPAEASALVDRLVAGRLLSVHRGRKDHARVELVHESLVRTWARLRRWLDESRDDHAFAAELSEAAKLWDRRGRPNEETWQGKALREALDKLDRLADDAPALGREFLLAGKRREDRRARRRSLALGAVMAVLAAAAVIAVNAAFALSKKERFANEQRAEADRQRELARKGEAQALREAARLAMLRGSFAEARARLRLALEKDDDLEARGLWWTLRREPELWAAPAGVTPVNLSWSPASSTLAFAPSVSITFLDARTLCLRKVAIESQVSLALVSFTPDGRSLVLFSGGDPKLRLIDAETGAVRRTFDGPAEPSFFNVPAVSPDGRWVAFAAGGSSGDGPPHAVGLIDLSTGATSALLAGHQQPVSSLAWSPDGRWLASSAYDGTVRLWEPGRREPRQVLEVGSDNVDAIAVSRDGSTLASSSGDRVIRLWDPASAKLMRALPEQSGSVTAIAFSARGDSLFVASDDGGLRRWSTSTGLLEADVASLAGSVGAVSVSADGEYLAAAVDNGVHVWRLGSPPSRPSFSASPEGRSSLAASPSSPVAATQWGGRIQLWDAATGEHLRNLPQLDPGINALDVSGDGRVLASASSRGVVRLWSLPWGTRRRTIEEYAGQQITGLALSADATRLAIATSAAAAIWDATVPVMRQTLSIKGTSPLALAFRPDGRELAAAMLDGSVRAWDAETGREKSKWRTGEPYAYTLAYAPDGAKLAVGGGTGALRLLTSETGRGGVVDSLPLGITSASFHPDRRLLLFNSSTWFRLWDLEASRPLWSFRPFCSGGVARFVEGGRMVAMPGPGCLRARETETAKPAWRTTLLLADPPSVLTHRGWRALDSGLPLELAPAQWRKAAEERAAQGSASPSGDRVCLLEQRGAIELWDRRQDELLFRQPAQGADWVAGLEGGCATFAVTPEANTLRIYGNAGLVKTVDTKLLFFDSNGAEAYFARDDKVVAIDANGNEVAEYPVGGYPATVCRSPDWLGVGLVDGQVNVTPLRPSFGSEPRQMRPGPLLSANMLRPGPGNTLVGGYASGEVVVWDLMTGVRLVEQALHGMVTHLAVVGNRVYAASEVGDSIVVDLDELTKPRCELLQDIWRAVPYVWSDGAPAATPPPDRHECAAH